MALLAACAGSPTGPTGPTAPSSGPNSGPTAPTAPTPPKAASTETATASAAPPSVSKPAQSTTPGPNLTPDGVVFNYKPAVKSKQIFVAGSFNDWNPSNQKYLLKDDDGDGTWSITVKLAPGTYQYKYVVDGQWTKDPYAPGDAPDGFGGRNGKFDVK